MSIDFHAWAEQLRQLHRALVALQPVAARVGVPAPDGQEWYELLRRKLLPQVEAEPLLVVAVVGGTNIGKSVIFNHLAGQTASGTSPLAAGTKHPVCLVPAGYGDEGRLAGLFEDFSLRPWQSPDDPLGECRNHLLFWKVGQNVPPRLLLLDTPDIDSDAQVNWQRADAIRQAADVLVAVLTQQKYNDAAVKKFFRRAVEADKPVVVVFNQCELDDDRPYWPQWLATFVEHSGARPELVYVVPYDRSAAGELRLPFYAVGPDGRQALDLPRSLRDDLAALHFDAIKIRTMRGAVAQVVDRRAGAGGYLADLREASSEFAVSARALADADAVHVDWPVLPSALLVDEIHHWWDAQRSDWSRQIHTFYRGLGRLVTWPMRAGWAAARGRQVDPLDWFCAQEREAVVRAVHKLLDDLDRLAQVGNDILRPRLQKLLGGASRRRLIDGLLEAHRSLPPIDDDYREFLRSELNAMKRDNPRATAVARALDQAAAVARPLVTVALAVTGVIVPAGEVVGQAVVHAAGQTASEVATAVAVTGGGEAVVSVAGQGVAQTVARLFGRLQTGYAQRRAAWLSRQLQQQLLGDLLSELQAGAEVATSPALGDVEAALAALQPGDD